MSSMKMKEIDYRGGLVRFSIPGDWEEEYDPDGGGTFYEPGDDTGTLILNVLSFLTKDDVAPNHPLPIFEKRKVNCNGKVETLSEDRYLLKYQKDDEEEGNELLIFYWEVAKMVSARDCNNAVFSYTIMKSQYESESRKREIEMLEESVKEVRFASYDSFRE